MKIKLPHEAVIVPNGYSDAERLMMFLEGFGVRWVEGQKPTQWGKDGWRERRYYYRLRDKTLCRGSDFSSARRYDTPYYLFGVSVDDFIFHCGVDLSKPSFDAASDTDIAGLFS